MLPSIEEYINYLAVERGLSENTLEAYARDLTQFAEFAAKSVRGSDEPQDDDILHGGQSTAASFIASTIESGADRLPQPREGSRLSARTIGFSSAKDT